MSSGALVQLGALGKQDSLTTLDPTLTFWKTMAKRHTNFSITPVEYEFSGVTDYGKKSTALLPRNGDLLARLWLRWDVDKIAGAAAASRQACFVDDYGRAAIDEVVLDIGSVTFDKLAPEFMHAWDELTTPYEKRCDQLTLKSPSIEQRLLWSDETKRQIVVPLPFYFCEDYGQSLPIVALHLTDIKISVKLKDKSKCILTSADAPVDPVTGASSLNGPAYTIQTNDAAITNMHLLAELVYLDDLERMWFADGKHSYVITQNQFLGSHSVGPTVASTTINLDFNHPVKEFIFMGRLASKQRDNQIFDFSGQNSGAVVAHPVSGLSVQPFAAGTRSVEQDREFFSTMSLKLNGSERLSEREAFYFSNIQPGQHHTCTPAGLHSRLAMSTKSGIYVYSFALDPQSPQVSGSLNFSRIDTTRMEIKFTSALNEGCDIFVFARNINQASVAKGVMLLSYATL